MLYSHPQAQKKTTFRAPKSCFFQKRFWAPEMLYPSHMPARLGQKSWYISFLRQKGSPTGSPKSCFFQKWFWAPDMFYSSHMPTRLGQQSWYIRFLRQKGSSTGSKKKQLFGAWKVDFFRAPSAPLWCSKETLWPRFFTRFLGAARRCFLTGLMSLLPWSRHVWKSFAPKSVAWQKPPASTEKVVLFAKEFEKFEVMLATSERTTRASRQSRNMRVSCPVVQVDSLLQNRASWFPQYWTRCHHQSEARLKKEAGM